MQTVVIGALLILLLSVFNLCVLSVTTFAKPRLSLKSASSSLSKSYHVSFGLFLMQSILSLFRLDLLRGLSVYLQ